MKAKGTEIGLPAVCGCGGGGGVPARIRSKPDRGKGVPAGAATGGVSAAARLCDQADGPTAVGYGGARGGGKSHWLLAQMGADDCQRVPGLKCLLLRKVGKANMEHFEDLRRRLFDRLEHEFSAFRGILTFKNGSRIIAGHFQNGEGYRCLPGAGIRRDRDRGGDDACRAGSIRTSRRAAGRRKPNWRPRIYSTTNPGGLGMPGIGRSLWCRFWRSGKRRRGSCRRGWMTTRSTIRNIGGCWRV